MWNCCQCGIVVLLCCLPISGVFGEDGWWKNFTKKSSSEEEAKRLLDQYYLEIVDEVDRADFRISGKVVDEAGRPLSDVRMDVRVHRNPSEGGEEDDYYTKLKKGILTVNIKKAKGVSLQFEKDSYYPAETNFGIPESMDQWAAVCEARRAGRKPVLKDIVVKFSNVQVILEKKGIIAILTTFDNELEYWPDGSGIVIDFDRLRGPGLEKQYVRKVTNMLDRASFPRNCAYILPELDGQGKAIPVELEGYRLPQRLHLYLSDTNGGFMMSELGYDTKNMHKMKQAPDAGYTQPLTFDAANLLKLGKVYGRMYQTFYLKVGGKYGKGYFYFWPMGINYNKEKKYVVISNIRVSIQPDGSRNLESGE